jgi:hypothetical protein
MGKQEYLTGIGELASPARLGTLCPVPLSRAPHKSCDGLQHELPRTHVAQDFGSRMMPRFYGSSPRWALGMSISTARSYSVPALLVPVARGRSGISRPQLLGTDRRSSARIFPGKARLLQRVIKARLFASNVRRPAMGCWSPSRLGEHGNNANDLRCTDHLTRIGHDPA